ncbi:hypothetical protein JKF63_06378 [Porcisia hertigi]|uniref:Uncharacterized protein n=1 Tax=Porcisia hertigi TaxID=2761500 RepID=A0A836LJU7_9TRYP|nr:hypothetical protein JKF63_06378 [Porcisia hertigi]
MLFLRHKQHMADELHQCCWYLPFFAMVVVFVLIGPAAACIHHTLDVNAVHKVNGAQATLAPKLQESILLDAFRMDTEVATPKDVKASVGTFVTGNSARYPWVYSWYNNKVNAWSPQPDANAAVDEQVTRVAASHHAPDYMRLSAVRTRRDVLRWLYLQLLPQLWDCKHPSHSRPWHSTVKNSHYPVGGVRIISRRSEPQRSDASPKAPTTPPQERQRTDKTQVGVERTARLVTPLLSDKRAAPPIIPSRICGRANPAIPSEKLFEYDADAGGYTALLPLATSCAVVSSVLKIMETPKRRIAWPAAYNKSVVMRELWMQYTETDLTPPDGNASAATASCASFLFDVTVSEVLVQYVLYRPKTRQYTVVEIRFSMASAGAVVQPQLRTFSLEALRWTTTFTSLAVSIVLILTTLMYGHHLLLRMVCQLRARLRRFPRPRRTLLQRLRCLLAVLVHTQNLVNMLALVLTTAMVVSWWHTVADLSRVPPEAYASRVEYPVELDRAVRGRGTLLRRLSAASFLSASVGLLRFACVTPGMWITLHTLVVSVPRLCLGLGVWLVANIGVSMAAVLLYGSALSEFRTFSAAYATLMYTLLDGGRHLFSADAVLRQTGQYAMSSFDDSLANVRGSSIGCRESVTLDYRVSTLEMANSTATPLFLLVVLFFYGLVGFMWCTATLAAGYRSVMLSPGAEALPLWDVSWARLAVYLAHAINCDYAKEVLRRVLLARSEAVMLAEMQYYLRIGCARAAAPAPAPLSRQLPAFRSVGSDYDASPSVCPANEPGVSLTTFLWMMPRELQLEYGAAHLRHWWYTCVVAVGAAQKSQAPWLPAQWRQHWEGQPDSLPSWLRASVPRDSTIEEQAARVGARLEELPDIIVKYVEGRCM